MIGEGRGEAILPPTSKARPRKGKGQPWTTSKGLEEAEPSKKSLLPSSKSEPSKKQARSSGKSGAPWRQNATKVLFV